MRDKRCQPPHAIGNTIKYSTIVVSSLFSLLFFRLLAYSAWRGPTAAIPCFFIAGPAGGKDQVLQFARLSALFAGSPVQDDLLERGKALLDVQVAGVHQDGVL